MRKLKGKLGESRNGRKFVQYLGYHMRKKPQRFQEAVPPEKWEGIRDATKFGSPCVQFDRQSKAVAGAEECMFLNIFTPQVPKQTEASSTPPTTKTASTTAKPSSTTVQSGIRKLPVLVYIHGGSFVSQSGQIFGAKYFLDEDVILVTLNYRLGVLGFLSTGDSDSIANLGLKVIIQSLRWIKDNISAFGGDSSKITLVGGSGGGAIASYLMLSPQANGLFSNVISESGNSMCPWVIVRNPKKVAEKLAAKLNCPGKTSKEIMSCIKGKSLKDIEIARVALQGFAEDPAVPFAPVVENWLPNDKAVIPDTPQKLLAQGKAAHIPWLTGYNSLNGLNLAVASILTTPKRLAQLDQDWNKLAPLIFHYSQTAVNPSNVSEQVRQYYFGNGKITEENKEKLVIALTDRNFIQCTANAALTQSKFGPVYLYTLSLQGAHSFLDEWGVRDKLNMRGVVHNDELPFLFNLALQSIPELKKGDKQTPFSEKMVKIWTSFAKNGKPSEQHEKTEFEWSPVLPSQSISSLRWYQLDSTSQSRSAVIESPTFKIWESFDLGEEALPSKNDGKIVIGYTMTEKPTVKPITPSTTHVNPASLSSNNQKPQVSPPLPIGGGTKSGNIISPSLSSVATSPTAKSPSQGYFSLEQLQQLQPQNHHHQTTSAANKAIITKPTSASPSSSGTTSTTTTVAPPAIHAVFLDEDPYSSTTTTPQKSQASSQKSLAEGHPTCNNNLYCITYLHLNIFLTNFCHLRPSVGFTYTNLQYLLEFKKSEGNPFGRVVTLPQGRIKGRYSETRRGRLFTEYFGIPYAQPPKRFKEARWPPPTWEWIKDGTKRPPPCYQMNGNMEIGIESCLTLNIHTPATHSNYWLVKDLPVLVMFHGGSWMVNRGDWVGGSGDQLGAKHFMDVDCVIVTVNYRLGVFGFLTFFNPDGPANLGLKDQVLALRWIRDNIASFGGNPNKVTIVGQGAGAAAVGLHLLSPMSKGLFHRAIMQSGSPVCHWALVDDEQQASIQNFIEAVGCTGTDAKEVLACLEPKSAKEIEMARQKIMTTFDDPFYPFGPVVEHWVRSFPKKKVFLPDYPLNILSDATNDTWGGIPIMMGVNSQDGLNFITGQYIQNPGLKSEYFTKYTKSYPPNFGYGLSTARTTEDTIDGITEKIREFYYESVPTEELRNLAHHQTHIDMYSHRNYYQCVRNAAVLYGKWSEMYLYYWSRVGTSIKKWHGYDKLNLTTGLANGDEIHFLFDPADDFGDYMMIRNSRPKHLGFSEDVVKIWVMFALDGKPVADWVSMKGREKSNLEWYELGDERLMMKEPFTKYADFWDSLGLDTRKELPPPGNYSGKPLGSKTPPPPGSNEGGFIYMDVDDSREIQFSY
ncbi:Esterase E4 [Orchesella cincta]|uniref:Esterase E4 n=1 Tax=Orchesella cincta TaxID=48709 RepID=A0A1D2MPH1_ORCCI|nr:Esterase E4 [Orchesella cincta]